MMIKGYNKCQVCGAERRVNKLTCGKKDISSHYKVKDGTFIINFLYCGDRTCCIEEAKKICIEIEKGDQ